MFELIARRPKEVIGLALLALAARVGYVLATAPRHLPFTDALFYQLQANALAAGHGFIQPVLALGGRTVPSAAHPPLYPLFLAAGSGLGARSVLAHQLMGCGLGTLTVVGAGMIAYRISGENAGLLAMGLAAVYPPLWVTDGGLMAEGLYTLLTAAVVLASYRWADRGRWTDAVVFGVVLGLATLTRAEAVVLFAVLVAPLVWSMRRGGWARAARMLALAVGAWALVVSPWVARNLLTFHHPVTLSTGNGTLLGANCPPAYYGAGIGTWYQSCYPPAGGRPGGDESDSASSAQRAGLHYIAAHAGRVPLVVAARVARVWQLYQPIADANNNLDDGRPRWANLVALYSYGLMVLLAVAGSVRLVRRRRPVLPLMAQLAAVSLTAAIVWGAVRFRAPAELVLAILAGAGLTGWPARKHDVPYNASVPLEGCSAR